MPNTASNNEVEHIDFSRAKVQARFEDLEESMTKFIYLNQSGLGRPARIASTEPNSQDGDYSFNIFTNFQSDAEVPILPNPKSIT